MDGLSIELNGPLPWMKDARDGIDHGRLSSSVRAEEGDDFSLFNPKMEVRQSLDIAIKYRDVLNSKQLNPFLAEIGLDHLRVSGDLLR